MDWHSGGYGPSGHPPASQHHQHAYGVTGQPSFPEQHGSYVQGPRSWETAGYPQNTYPSTANTNYQPQREAPPHHLQNAGSTGGQAYGQPGPATGQYGCTASAIHPQAMPGYNPPYPGTPSATAYQHGQGHPNVSPVPIQPWTAPAGINAQPSYSPMNPHHQWQPTMGSAQEVRVPAPALAGPTAFAAPLVWLGSDRPQLQPLPGMPPYGTQMMPSPAQHPPQHPMLPPGMAPPPDGQGDEPSEDGGDTDPEDEAECETLRSQLAAALQHSRGLEARLRPASAPLAPAPTPSMPPLPTKGLDPGELKMLTTKMTPAKLTIWGGEFCDTLSEKHQVIAALVGTLSRGTFKVELDKTKLQQVLGTVPLAEAANAYIAQQILKVLNRETPTVEAFMSWLHLHQIEGWRRCGMQLLELIVSEGWRSRKTTAELEQAYNEFKRRPFFKAGMTVDEFTAAAAAFRNEFMTLATKYRSDPFALERTFLSAIPDQFEAERATEIRDINRAEGQGKALSFSWDELVGGMAAAVSRARSAPPTAHDTEVNAAERERFDRARLEREKREKQESASRLVCNQCGKTGHAWKDCKATPCPISKMPFCECVYGAQCTMLKKERPTTENTKTAGGQPMNAKLVKKLAHLHDEHNKPKTSAFHSDFSPEASVCEVCPPEVGFELPKSFAEEQRRARERAHPQNVDRDQRQSLLRNGRDDPARPELRNARAELLNLGLPPRPPSPPPPPPPLSPPADAADAGEPPRWADEVDDGELPSLVDWTTKKVPIAALSTCEAELWEEELEGEAEWPSLPTPSSPPARPTAPKSEPQSQRRLAASLARQARCLGEAQRRPEPSTPCAPPMEPRTEVEGTQRLTPTGKGGVRPPPGASSAPDKAPRSARSRGGRGGGVHPLTANAFEIAPRLVNVEPEFTPPPIQVTAYGGLVEPQREGYITFLLDGGANGHILNRQGAALIESSTTVSTVQQAVNGIDKRSTGLVAEKFVSRQLSFSPEVSAPFDAWFVPESRRNILSESSLYDLAGVEITKERVDPAASQMQMVFTRCEHLGVKIEKANGLYWVLVPLGPNVPRALHANALTVGVDDENLLWATRMVCNSNGLDKIKGSVIGLEKLGATKASVKQIIDVDRYRVKATNRRESVAQYTNSSHLDSTPGSTFILDGYGPVSAQSVVDGSTYAMGATCEATGYGYEHPTKKHTAETWIEFITHVFAEQNALGLKCTKLRLDMAGEFRTESFRARIESTFGCAVELAPSGHHEGVGRREKDNDTLSRMAESMCERKNLGASFHLAARSYAQFLLNRKCRAPSRTTRFQHYSRRPVDLSGIVPYIFGTSVVILNDEQARGGKGTTNRSADGILLGIRGSSYIVLKSNGSVVYPPSVKPLDELQLVRAGIPASGATASAMTQTEDGDFPPLLPLAPAPSAQPRLPPAREPYQAGDEIEALYNVDGKRKWMRASVVSSRPTPSGRTEYELEWEDKRWVGQQAWRWIDLQRADGPEHRFAPARPPSTAAVAPTAAADVPVDAARQRLRPRLPAAVVQLCEAAAQDQGGVNVYNSTLFQLLGDAADSLECSHVDEIASSLARVRASTIEANLSTLSSGAPAELEVYKATQNVIDYVTDLGPAQIKVPTNERELNASPEKEQWLSADARALNDAILAIPGNRLVKTKSVIAKGGVIGPCVTHRKVKVDQSSRRLAEHNPFKSRHCYAANRVAHVKKSRGVDDNVPTSSAVCDDLTVRLTLADACGRRRHVCKADVGNAYGHASRISSVAYMAMPKTLQTVDEEGDELCIELGGAPLWGESQAGFEWYLELCTELEKQGWRQGEIPCAWHFTSERGDARLLTIVDDLLISESASSEMSITNDTLAALRKRFGEVTSEQQPTSFAGYRLAWAADRSAVTLSMEQKVVEAVRAHMPELLDGKKPAGLLRGEALQKAADELMLRTPAEPQRPGRPDPDGKTVQCITGSLRFVEKIMPRLGVIVHRLSCVMSNPPPGSLAVARAALTDAYEHRRDGLTYGGGGLSSEPRLTSHMIGNVQMAKGAPAELECTADATWDMLSLYSILLTYMGADVGHVTKKISVTCDSSMHSEAYASSRATEAILYAREVLRFLGVQPVGPTTLYSDNKANILVAMKTGTASRAKHLLRRYVAMQEQVKAGEIVLAKIDDNENPSDYLSKWVNKHKMQRSDAYAINPSARVET